MTDSTSENQAITDQPNPPLWVKWLRRTAIGLGLVVVVTAAAGGTWLWFFVKNDLGSLVERELTKLIDRPVKIGPIEQFYLTGLKVGLSSLPATESDPDFAEIPTVKVGFNPLTLLLSRTLNLKISLIDPSIYIEQDSQGAWLQLKIKKSQASSKTININIKTIEIDDGQVMLLPNGAKRSQLFKLEQPMEFNPLVLEQVNIEAKFFNRQTETKYQATARPTSSGSLKINGHTNLSTLDTELYINGDYLSAVEVMPLIPNLPLRLDSGQLNCRLGLNLQETTVLSWDGQAKFSNIHGYLGNLTQPISDASGQIKFSELQVALNDVKAVYGELPLKVNGTIDTKSDYDLAMSIPSLNLAHYINTLELKLPVPVSGSARTELQVTGPLQSPILSGLVVSTDPLKVDLIDVAAAQARFKLEAEGEKQQLEITDITAEPVVGGLVYGRGNIQLTEIPELGFYLLGENLPGDAIAELYLGEYRVEKPSIKIGRINGSATVLGQVDKPTTIVKWRSPESMYPGRGEVTITKETTVLRNTIFQVGGGTVNVTGSMVPKEDRWQALLNAQNIELNQLTSPTRKGGGSRTAPKPENPAILAGGLRLSGKLSSLVPADIKGSGELELITPDAKVTGRGTLDQGQWKASLGVETLPGKALRLHELAPDLPVPMELGSGTLELSGTVDSFEPKFEPKKIDATGSVQLNVAETATVTASGSLNEGQVTASATLTTANDNFLSLNPWAPNLEIPVNLTAGTLELSGPVDRLFSLNRRAGAPMSARSVFNTWSGNSTIQLLIAGAAVTGRGNLQQGQVELSAILNSDNFLSLNPWAPNLEIPVNLTAGTLELSGPVDRLFSLNRRAGAPMSARSVFNTWSGNSTIQLLIAGAAVTGRGNLQQGQVELSAILNSDNFLSLNPWAPNLEIPVNLTAGTLELSGPVDRLFSLNRRAGAPMSARSVFNTWSGNSNVTLNLAGGTIAGIGHFTGDRWQGSITAENLNLNPLAPNLSEPVNLATGSLNLSGFLSSFAPQDIQADGEFTLIKQLRSNFPENSGQRSAISQFLPLYSAFRWTGEILEIQQAKSPGLEVDGTLFVDWQEQQPIVSNFDLNLKVNQFNLATLSLPIPGREPVTNVNLENSLETPPIPDQKRPSQLPFMPLAIAGLVDFNGRLRGQLNPELFQNYSQAISELLLKSQISIAGDLATENLRFNDWQFSLLSGKINLETDRGLQVNLEGDQAEISLEINNPLPSRDSYLVSQLVG
jgi:translocation and assembly module TamB